MESSILAVENAALGYEGHAILSAVSLSLGRGDYLGIVGPNGAGKSTLLKSLLGMVPLISGRVVRPVPLTFGYVPQSSAIDDIFPLTVDDVVTSAVDLRPDLTSHPIPLTRLLDEVGLAHRRRDRFHDLSGGQKQRVLLARAMALDPDVLVLDEPTNGLDLSSEVSFMAIVDRLSARGRTILLVTHILNLVANYARQIAIVKHGAVTVGATARVLTDEALRDVYGPGVTVGEISGQRVVVATHIESDPPSPAGPIVGDEQS